MKIRFDASRCTGHGRCHALAPEVFGEDDDGRCLLAQPEVPEDLQAKARLAVANCPEEALAIQEAAPS